MLTIFKDAAQMYPVTPQRPLTFLLPEAGGKKEVTIWVVATGLSGSTLTVTPVGSDQAQFPVMLRPGGQDWVPGAPFSFQLDGQSVIIALPVSVSAAPGTRAQHDLLNLQVSAGSETATASCRVIQANQDLSARFRALPSNRIIKPTLPGFLFGSHRWRDQDQVNGQEIVKTNWTIDPVAIGPEKFVAGIGYREDLELVGLQRGVVDKDGTVLNPHSVFPRIRHGFYFTGYQGYYLPSDDAVLEVVPTTSLQFTLPRKPAQLPVFVGTYRQDDNGYYDTDVSYRYLGKGMKSADGFDAGDSGLQFLLDRSTSQVTMNRAITPTPVYAGLVPDATEVTLNIPVYPVLEVVSIYLDTADVTCDHHSFDPVTNTIHVIFPAGHIGGTIFINYTPALAVLYEAVPGAPDASLTRQDGTRLLAANDLNPGFTGISRGYLYLMHRRHKAGALQLAADKPRILVPATAASIVGLVAFGPVYYENDYALLLASVTGNTQQEFIPNVRLRVIPGADFQGLINYLDPRTQHVEVVSGGDGTASFIYTPPAAYGFYLDGAASVVGARINLPEPVALTQIWNLDEGWLPTTYIVRDDHPFLGKVNANTSVGEVPWQTWNAPGSILYRTNGMRQMWADAAKKAICPVQAYDAARSPALIGAALNPAFSGNAVVLEYAAPLPTAANIGAYFISFIGRIQLQVQDLDTGLISNTILLQLEVPPPIQDAPDVSGYLYLDTHDDIKQGYLSAPVPKVVGNRLGGAPIPQYAFNAPRY